MSPKCPLLLLLLGLLAAPAWGEAVREVVAVRYADLNEVKGILATLVPDVMYAIAPGGIGLILEGEPSALEQGRVRQACRPGGHRL